MRLASIINFWDCGELLPIVVKNMRKLVDGIIIVFSDSSNYRDYINNTAFLNDPVFEGCHIFRCEPLTSLQPMDNERRKRNFGLEKAKELGFTHFLDQDADELYEHEPFLKEKERFLNPELNGLCCACEVFFKSPTLSVGLDITIVPFIHKIMPDLRHEWNKNYPFAFVNGGIRVDPTRQLSYTSGIEWSNIVMKHYSYIRKDLEQKIRNSTARHNIERSTLRQDFVIAKAGEFCNFYGKVLTTAPNTFNIPDYGEFLRKDLQPDKTADKAT